MFSVSLGLLKLKNMLKFVSIIMLLFQIYEAMKFYNLGDESFETHVGHVLVIYTHRRKRLKKITTFYVALAFTDVSNFLV